MAALQMSELDAFSERLFRSLDRLGGDLLPRFLSGNPSAFEKYPRMLVALMQRHGAQAGFEEWRTKILRDANKYRKEKEFPELEALRAWVLEHEELFKDKQHLAHLKRSFYGRAYAYLYPRRRLITAYTQATRNDDNESKEKVTQIDFREVVAVEIEQLRNIYGDSEKLETIIKDAEYFFKARQYSSAEPTSTEISE
jgi:hypothetical protein